MSKSRILIVDDDEGVREALRLILYKEYDLVFAGDGKGALAKLGEGSFELVLLDIKMPRLDGLEVLRQLKRNGACPRILMLTAYQSVELAKEAVKLGALDYLPKPFDQEHVLEVVHGLLAQR